VFTSTHEFPALAAALGEEQPLVGLRSLNAVLRPDKIFAWDDRAVAGHYSADVLEALGTLPCFVGGNCQGAPIAGELARELLLADREVLGFIGMEWAAVPALPVRSALIFGTHSERHNPFLQGLNPWPIWRSLYPSVNCTLVPGGHGEYFAPDRIAMLGRAIQQALAQPLFPRRPSRPATDIEGIPQHVPAATRFESRLTTVENLEPSDTLLLLWDSHFSCFPHREIVRFHHGPDQRCWFEATAPKTRGSWTLQAFLSQDGRGPQAWAMEATRFWEVTVT
jgi:hypothetical protein